MNAGQEDLRRPPGAYLLQRRQVPLILALFVTAVAMAGWYAIGMKQPYVGRADPQAHPISELRALPGVPEDLPSARLMKIGSEEARKLNAATPFAKETGGAADPFRFTGNPVERSRATDCLAIAAMAEAGDSGEGQRAVIQVVLNRVRHAAFAKTICGVVFEGSHRVSGCQFTFTCDGALARRYSTASWAHARSRASDALNGLVFSQVGLSTHYHTDWVHPYWSNSLIKVAQVDTHLFFRWPGYWGSAASLSVPYRGGEPAISQLAYLPAHSESGNALAEQGAPMPNGSAAVLADVVVRNADGGAFVMLAGASSANSAREIGRRLCSGRPSCKVLGWFERAAIPRGYPVPPTARAQLGFSYFLDAHNDEIVLYDCMRFSGIQSSSCIPAPVRTRIALKGKSAASSIAVTPLLSVPSKHGFPRPTKGDLLPSPVLD